MQKVMQKGLINVNGQMFDRETADSRAEAKISVFDRGYLYGDSLYEVCRTYGGKLFMAREHLVRMAKSAELCRMAFSQPLSLYLSEMEKTLAEFHRSTGKPKDEAYVRIIVSRGIGRIGFGTACVESPSQYVVIVQPLEEPTAEQFKKGFALQVSERLRNDRRALDPAMKSGNYLNSLLAFLEAAEEDFDDALLCNHDGHVTEGTTFNVGYIRRGIIATPPLDIGILDGLTRRLLFEIAAELGIPMRETRFPRERLYEADEVFMCSTIKEVFPVTRVDGKKIGNGGPGPITRKLRDAFRKTATSRLDL
jgi:branched-chain amino acid aminotransferase